MKDVEIRDFDVQHQNNSNKMMSINEEKNDLMGMIKRKDLEITQLKRKLMESGQREEIPIQE